MSASIVVIAGAASNTGKTTLLCDLLRAMPSDETWEAIKLTRGHYRSCGKDPHACCVSHLLGDKPLIRSGRRDTDVPGKDTGRYWEAGAANVHWVISTDDQVEDGIRTALSRVISAGVLIEGTSVLKFLQPDFAALAIGGDGVKIKPSARRALLDDKIDALYTAEKQSATRLSPDLLRNLPVFDPAEVPALLTSLRARLLR
jgi:molybdopterin-guanine dinucleotide biosynthesis protein